MYRSDLENGGLRYVHQGTLLPNSKGTSVNSYKSHVFIAVDPEENRVVFVGVVKDPSELSNYEYNGEHQLFKVT